MYENVGKPVSKPTKIWLVREFSEIFEEMQEIQGILHLIGSKKPMLHSFQGALPHLPLPSLDETVQKVSKLSISTLFYLLTPILNESWKNAFYFEI